MRPRRERAGVSAQAARGFAPVLREVERGLALPIPERVRILRELEFDLEELCARLVAGGLSEELARGRAQLALWSPDPGLRFPSLVRASTPMAPSCGG